MSQDRYESTKLDAQIDPEKVYDREKNEFSGMSTKASVPSYRHAQKEAMQRGDADTYFGRKVGKKKRSSASSPRRSRKAISKRKR